MENSRLLHSFILLVEVVVLVEVLVVDPALSGDEVPPSSGGRGGSAERDEDVDLDLKILFTNNFG